MKSILYLIWPRVQRYMICSFEKVRYIETSKKFCEPLFRKNSALYRGCVIYGPDCISVTRCYEAFGKIQSRINRKVTESYQDYRCKHGFHLFMAECADIDECGMGIPFCGKLHCANTVGTYTCGCRDGFEKVVSGNVYACSDIDECENKRIYPKESTCQNFNGGYSINCKTGFDGERCLVGFLYKAVSSLIFETSTKFPSPSESSNYLIKGVPHKNVTPFFKFSFRGTQIVLN